MKATEARTLVRQGYDLVSRAYRGDEFDLKGTGYAKWLGWLTPKLATRARILDLGCGCGVPIARVLAEQHTVTGVDHSPVQIERAKGLVPNATFQCEDMTAVEFEAAAFDAIVSLYAIVHVPLEEQPALLQNLARWLAPDGWLLASVGKDAWTGTRDNWRDVPGATMYWSHADARTYRTWLAELGFTVIKHAEQIDSMGARHMVVLANRKVN